MTPEYVEYYRAMLLAGIDDPFYRAFDRALEEEDPLSDLVLSLCTCVSDETAVLHILREYTLDHKPDDQAVCDLIVEDLRTRYLSGEMDRKTLGDTLYRIALKLDKLWEDPWCFLTSLAYDLELWEDGIISEDVFDQCFDSWLFQGKQLNPWDLQRKHINRNP